MIKDTMMQLLSAALTQTKDFSVNVENWADLYGELRAQAVHVLIADYAQKLNLTEEQKDDYVKVVARNIQFFHTLMMEQSLLMEKLQAAGIRATVLKGAAAACYYPIPEYRCMGDIDVLVLPEEFERAFAVMQEQGYHSLQSLDEGKRHIEFKSTGGIKIELHRHFSDGNRKQYNQRLDYYLYNGIDRREIRAVCGYSVPMLPALENGLVLLAHINQHLSEGLGFRQILDWMMYVKSELGEQQWEQFRPVAKSIGLEVLAQTVTLLCKKYFQLTEVSWCDSADEELADRLLDYIVDRGNFGSKYDTNTKSVRKVVHSFRNPLTAFRYLTAGGVAHWNAAQKHKCLRAFAWIYQIGHLMRVAIRKKIKPGQTSKEYAQGMKESELLRRLRVTKF